MTLNQTPNPTPAALDPISPPSGDSPARSRHTTWYLFGQIASEDVRHIPIAYTPFRVGRGPNTSLCLGSMTVSGVHAELTQSGESLLLEDLGSTNGTYVNGQRIAGTVELRGGDLVQFGEMPFRVFRQAAPGKVATICENVTDRARALVQFDRLMREQAVIPFYQPIVELPSEQVLAFEVLARARMIGLETPALMFSVAAQLNLESQLSQMVRAKAVQETCSCTPPPHLFLNTHPRELEEPGLRQSLEPLRRLAPSQRMTLEIHEKAVTDADTMMNLRGTLRDLDIHLAFDDFGAGQARLLELSRVHPDYLKFDITLIRSLHLASREHRQMMASLVRMVREMGIVPLAEGIESSEERDACLNLGFELAQGFYFGKPIPLPPVAE